MPERRATGLRDRRTARLRPAWLVLVLASASFAEDPAASQVDFFERRIRPVLAERCFECHGQKKQEAGLRLDSRAAVLKGSDSGPVVEPGKPDESLLVEAIGHSGAVKMPPKGKLSDAQIADLDCRLRPP